MFRLGKSMGVVCACLWKTVGNEEYNNIGSRTNRLSGIYNRDYTEHFPNHVQVKTCSDLKLAWLEN